MQTIRNIWKLLKYRPGLFFVTSLCWGAFHSSPIFIGLLVREIFNTMSGDASVGFDVWSLLAFLVAVSLGRVVIMIGGVWTWSTLYYTLGSLVRRNIFDWIMNGPGTRKLPGSPGEAVTRFRDDVDELMEYVENVTDFTGIAVMATAAIIIMAKVDPVITVVALLPLIGIFIFGYSVGGRIRRYRRATREATGRITSFIGEVFGGVQAVKVAAAEENVVRHFDELNEQRRGVAVKDALFGEIFRSVNSNMVNVGIGLILLIVAQKMRADTFTAGDLALFVTYLGRLSWNMFFFGDVIAQHKRVGVSFERLGQLTPTASADITVLDNPLYMVHDAPEIAIRQKQRNDKFRVLTGHNLTYRYPSTGRGIEGIDLEVRRGEFVVVTGKIGSGKTTLLRALLGLVEIEEGEMLWNGARVIDPAAFMTPPRVAYTSQAPRLFSDTLRLNILMGQQEVHSAVGEAVNLAVMEPDIARLEDGLETKVGPRGVKLSGGQVQRSAAARMFVRDAELLIIDDLSSALDVETEALLWDRLFGQREATCLVASHRRAALHRADRIILLDDGKVEAVGTLDELLAMNGTMQELWETDEKSVT